MIRTGMFSKTTAALVMACALGTTASANIVYQDNFDDDGLATNTGIGGGMSFFNAQGSLWDDDGSLSYTNTGDGGDRAYVASNNTFAVSGGFILTVEWTGSGTFPELTSFGLVAGDPVGDSTSEDILATAIDGESAYAIGIELGNLFENADNNVEQGLKFNNNGTVALLSDSQSLSASGPHTLVLTVDAAGNFSYSVDGAPASTGSTGGLDLSANYRFYAYGQWEELTIDSVTLETPVPEPTSLALLGLGGLLIARRRRA